MFESHLEPLTNSNVPSNSWDCTITRFFPSSAFGIINETLLFCSCEAVSENKKGRFFEIKIK